MRFIKLKKSIHHYYLYEEGTDLPLYILVNFLITSCPLNSKKSWQELISSNVHDYTSGILTFIEWDTEKVWLSDIYDESAKIELTSKNSITIPKKEFFTILDRWEELVTQQPDEIIITQDDAGKISITGKFADGKEI